MANPETAAIIAQTTDRSSDEQIRASRKKLKQHDVALQILEGFPGLAVILDKNRQIVAFNKSAMSLFKGLRPEEVYGKRLGEAFRCIHASEDVAGCGGSKFCVECGSANTIKLTKDSQANQIGECRIATLTKGKEGALNLRVYTSPLTIDGEPYTLFTIKDIAQEQRLQALERIFFHDVLNTAAAINSIALLLNTEQSEDDRKELTSLLKASAMQLIQEIHAQRDLVTAERGELAFTIEAVSTRRIIDSVLDIYLHHDLARDRKLVVEPCKSNVMVETGPVHLIRCIGNLVKNALEASNAGEEVRIACQATASDVTFSVHNRGVMPESVQLQVFQRSFSTKARLGRGIGTYSVKLLVGQYLHGEVWFESSEEKGTVFYIKLPRKFRRK